MYHRVDLDDDSPPPSNPKPGLSSPSKPPSNQLLGDALKALSPAPLPSSNYNLNKEQYLDDNDADYSTEEIWASDLSLSPAKKSLFRFPSSLGINLWTSTWNNRFLVGGTTATVLVAVLVLFLLTNPPLPLSLDSLPSDHPIVILVSLDGLRPDYLNRSLTPNLLSLAASGIMASHLTPSFPSLTFPNHYSIVTGLYPESHGIVANVFWDSLLNDTFVYVDPVKNKDSKWWFGEPIWVTAVKNGLKSATCMWPGSEAAIKNTRPTYYQPYNGSMSNIDRVSQVLTWLALPLETRPAFLTLYISDIDTAGHVYGPDSPQVNAALQSVDAVIGKLVEGVLHVQNVRALQNSTVNIVVVSDHGMTPGNALENFIYLDDYVDPSLFSIINNVNVFIYPKNENDTETIYKTLLKAALNSTHWTIHKRAETPPEYHYTLPTSRIAPLVAIPKRGYAITLRSTGPGKLLGGLHGYNNSDPDMRATFIASGPAFHASERALGTGASEFESGGGGELVVDSAGMVELVDGFDGTSGGGVHGGAAVAGDVGKHTGGRRDVGGGGGGGGGDWSGMLERRRTGEMNLTSNVVTSGNATKTRVALQLVPPFKNVEIYNILLRVLKLEGKGAPNNGSKETMDMLSTWLTY
ncbi:hypothetical protein HDU79_004945 [Rhizoclosmatium sp. JEL0117]|nr:hypothetical protein HDU79_004945 [Rhizoclosmatium sp. JEL0117]